VALIQKYYTVDRIIKLTSGKNEGDPVFAKMSQGEVTLMDRAGKAIKTIKTNEDTRFEIEMADGTELPRSRTEMAQLTTELAKNGVFGSIEDIDVKELILKALDYQNWRAIIQVMREKQKQVLPPSLPIDKLNTAFKDLPPEVQIQILTSLGFTVQPIIPATVPTPAIGGNPIV
jgi:hypothetical protein